MSVKSAGNLSTLFDVGGIIGGVLAGYISDRVNARATTAATFMYLAIPALFAYQTFGPTSKTVNILLMLTAGMLVNGPYSLITTAVSADLGTHSSLNGDSRALATVTAIIDGTGSAGAALGPLLTGILSTKGWGPVFAMLSVSSFTAGALLTFLVKAEIAEILRLRRQKLAIRSEGNIMVIWFRRLLKIEGFNTEDTLLQALFLIRFLGTKANEEENIVHGEFVYLEKETRDEK